MREALTQVCTLWAPRTLSVETNGLTDVFLHATGLKVAFGRSSSLLLKAAFVESKNKKTRWTSSQHYSSKEEGVGGVGWGRFVAISPLQKNWGSRIEGCIRNTRVSYSSLNSGEFTFYSCKACSS